MNRRSELLKWSILVALFPLSANGDSSTAPASQPDQYTTVKRGDLKLDVKCDGWFEAVAPVEIRIQPRAYQGDWRIVSVAANGAAVKKGDVLLKLDTDEIQRQIAAASNELKTAGANLEKAEADMKLGAEADKIALSVQEQAEKNASDAVGWWEKVDGPLMLKQYERQVKFAKINVDDQSDELDQLKKMYKSEDLTNATSDIVVKRAVRQLEIANETLGMAQQQVEKGKATEYEQARRNVDNALAQQRSATEQLKASQAQAKAQREAALFQAKQNKQTAQRKLDDLQEDLSGMTVAAPADGIVLYGKLAQGTWQNNNAEYAPRYKVQPDQVLMTFVEPGKVQVIAPVPEDAIARVVATQQATITPKALPELQSGGKVAAVPVAATIGGDPAKFQVVITPDKTDPRFLPGYRAAVTIDTEDATGVMIVPTAAVSGGKVKVHGASDESRDVVTGRSDGEHIEIVRGLRDGEQVLSTYKKD